MTDTAITSTAYTYDYTITFSWAPQDSILAAYAEYLGQPDIYVYNVTSTEVQTIGTITPSDGDTLEQPPSWSPNGQHLSSIFYSNANNSDYLLDYLVTSTNVTQVGTAQTPVANEYLQYIWWSPDSSYMIVQGHDYDVQNDFIAAYTVSPTAFTQIGTPMYPVGYYGAINYGYWSSNSQYFALYGTDNASNNDFFAVYTISPTAFTQVGSATYPVSSGGIDELVWSSTNPYFMVWETDNNIGADFIATYSITEGLLIPSILPYYPTTAVNSYFDTATLVTNDQPFVYGQDYTGYGNSYVFLYFSAQGMNNIIKNNTVSLTHGIQQSGIGISSTPTFNFRSLNNTVFNNYCSANDIDFANVNPEFSKCDSVHIADTESKVDLLNNDVNIVNSKVDTYYNGLVAQFVTTNNHITSSANTTNNLVTSSASTTDNLITTLGDQVQQEFDTTQSAIDTVGQALNTCCDTMSSMADVADSKLDDISSKVGNIDFSRLTSQISTVDSKVDAIAADINNTFTTLEHLVQQEFDTTQSAIDTVGQSLNACCDTMSSMADVADSKLDDINSKVGNIDFSQLTSQISTVDSKVDATAADINNTFTTLEHLVQQEFDTTQSAIDTVGQSLNACCDTMSSMADVADSKLDDINSKVGNIDFSRLTSQISTVDSKVDATNNLITTLGDQVQQEFDTTQSAIDTVGQSSIRAAIP